MRRVGTAVLSAWLWMAAAGLARAESFDAIVRDAESAYNVGKFDEAATLLDKAYAIRRDPALLYNKGRALQDIKPAQAITAYEAYLAAEPGAADAPKVRLIVERLRARLAQEEALRRKLEEAEATRRREDASRGREPDASAQSARTRQGASAIPWLVTGVGAATLVASIPLWVIGSNAHDDAVAAPSAAESDSRQRTANDFAAATSVTLVAGSLLTALGVAWVIFDLARGAGTTPSAVRRAHVSGQGTF